MGVFTSHELEFAGWSLSTMRPGSLSTANRYERCDVTLDYRDYQLLCYFWVVCLVKAVLKRPV